MAGHGEVFERMRMPGPERASYASHYRRMVPQLLDALEFRLNNANSFSSVQPEAATSS